MSTRPGASSYSSNPHSSSSAPSRVIFIGNIPFEVTEEQLIDIFKEVGPVQSIRLMFDRETGRSRGYAFCEYADPETAASAIRNLSGYELAGRNLKVDKADNDMLPSSVAAGGPGSSGNSSSHRPDSSSMSVPSSSSTSSAHHHQRKPVQNLSNYSSTPATTAIHNILNAPPFTNPQTLMDVLTSMKGTIQSNPEQMRHLLSSNPALAYALLQSFISLGLVDMSTVQSLLVQAQQPTQSPPPPPSQQQSTTPASSAEQQRALIMQIMSMTPEQINMLPPQQREQVIQLKQQIMNQQQQHRAV